MTMMITDLSSPRLLAGRPVRPIGLGCMNLNHGYTHFLDDDAAVDLLVRAVTEAGIDHLDTATLYGGGRNEELVGRALSTTTSQGRLRDRVLLASKCGLTQSGDRRFDGRPETLRAQVEDSLRRLQTDHIDLYYLHRLDPEVPVEESAGALAEMISQGKIGAYGLSEISAETLRRADAVHPVGAVQNEYSLWTRNPEWGLLEDCRETGTTLVAFSPVARGFLSDAPPRTEDLAASDVRSTMPRFSGENYPENLRLREKLAEQARAHGTTVAALALAWVLAQGENVVAIPGTINWDHLLEDQSAEQLRISPVDVLRWGDIINHATVHGHRYAEKARATIDTEDAPA